MDEKTDNSYMTIYDMLSRVHKKKQINQGDIAEWAAECETEWIADIDNMIGYSGIAVKMLGRRALIPCNVYRIVKVYTDRNNRNSEINFTRTGRYINFDKTYQQVYIDYFGIIVDEDGYPVILPGHMQAIEAFCVHKLYYEDYLNNEMDHNRWAYITEDMKNKMADAKGSIRAFTFEDLNSLNYIRYSMVPKIGTMDFMINQ